MSLDIFMYLIDESDHALPSESLSGTLANPFGPVPTGAVPTEIQSYSFDVEQTLNIGSQSTGAGAGKVTFNPLTITKRVDVNSQTLFKMCCSGTPFKTLDLLFVKAGTAKPVVFAGYRMGLVAVKTISEYGNSGDDGLTETLSFEYGSLSFGYAQQKPDGSFNAFHYNSWDRVKNVAGPTG